MGKKGIIYIIIAVVTLGAILLLQYNKPKNINWYESYVSTHKIPYGTLVFNELMETKLFPNKIKQLQVPPFEFLSENNKVNGTYVFINNSVQFQEAELHILLDWVSEGNTLFVASEGFEEKLKDTLQLDTGVHYAGFEVAQQQDHQLVNPLLQEQKKYRYEKDKAVHYFDVIDTLKSTVIGTIHFPNDAKEDQIAAVSVIKTPFGKGEIILSTFPKAFTNHFILEEENKSYTAGLVSYLNEHETIFMDNHYKSGKTFYTSPMHIFLNTKELKWAYYLALIGVLIYVVFEGKRKQRAVPVITPLKNQTLAFTRTISDMYFEKGDQKAIVEHKINYFLDYLRTKYYIGNIDNEDDFYKNLAARSNYSFDDTKALFRYMEKLRAQSQITDNELMYLNKRIQKFKSETDGK
ncbi:DUF4350 domain-containing protein [Maribacter sp. R77961]|uniref:DUF4350 domain-containing protein n=1 Tax=Maribacter sp. R77961 TaxID=3093871 RepID=UPI0037C95895